MRKSLQSFLVEYGAIGLAVYLTTTFFVYLGFWIALRFGWKPSGAVGNAGYWLTAYVAAKATQPFRIAGSIAVTPFVARIYERVTGRRRARDAAGRTSTS